MLVYLSKRITIPNQIKLNCISWNRDQGYIACGGESGLLKVLKLETPSGPDAFLQGIAASSNLSMYHTLDGHNGAVMCATWNPVYRKLTTSDESGLIIVWVLHRGTWYEEMINNRNKSVVRDMKWTADGHKIAIVYEDGAIIVGSVDGNRLWGKELNISMRFVEWSPDSKLLLFVTNDAEVLVYDCDGNKLRTLRLVGPQDSAIVAIHWYCPYSPAFAATGKNAPFSLAIAFENGMVQLSRGEDSSSAMVLDTDLQTVSYAVWSAKGTYLSVVGFNKTKGGVVNILKFYTNLGVCVRSLKIPGERVRELSWEAGDQRLALAVDSFIYFANIRHRYTFTYFANTVVYPFAAPLRRDQSLVFWNTATGEAVAKPVPAVALLASRGDLCAVVVPCPGVSSTSTSSSSASAAAEEGDKAERGGASAAPREAFVVQLRNSIGVVVDSKAISFTPKHISMSEGYVVLANDRTVWCWQYPAGGPSAAAAAAAAAGPADDLDDDADDKAARASKSAFVGKLKMFDVTTLGQVAPMSPETFAVSHDSLPDPLTAALVCDKYLLFARRHDNAGPTITRCTLPHLSIDAVYSLAQDVGRDVVQLAINCTFSRLALVDAQGVLSALDLDARNGGAAGGGDAKDDGADVLGPLGRKLPGADRKDVWDVMWAEDSADTLAVLEKTKLHLLSLPAAGSTLQVLQEPLLCSAYPIQFRDLEIKALAADDLFFALHTHAQTSRSAGLQIANNAVFTNPAYIISIETRLLTQLQEKLVESVEAAYQFACANPHKKLFQVLSTHALQEGDYAVAERCMVRMQDYFGVRFLKEVQAMTDKMKMKAEVLLYLDRSKQAEAIYKEIDRKDLAVAMYSKVGAYAKVVQLLQTGGGNDKLLAQTHDRIGQAHYLSQALAKAVPFFSLARNYPLLIDCHFRLQNHAALRALARELPENAGWWLLLASRFELLGMCEEAVECYAKCHALSSSSSSSSSSSGGGGGGEAVWLPGLGAVQVAAADPIKRAIDCAVHNNKWALALGLSEAFRYPQIEAVLAKRAFELISSHQLLAAIELFRGANKPTEAAMVLHHFALGIAGRHDLRVAKKLYVLSALEVERHKQKALGGAGGGGGGGAGGGALLPATLGLDPSSSSPSPSSPSSSSSALPAAGADIAEQTAHTVQTLMMTSLLEGALPGRRGDDHGTLAVTMTTLQTLATAGATATATGTGTAGDGDASAQRLNRALAKAFANAWRGAAAYHFYLLALRQLVAGAADACMKTAIHLCDFDDLLPPRSVYALLALAAYRNRFFATCSKAFVKLETLPLAEADRDAVHALAVALFTRHPPQDAAPLLDVYSLALDLGRAFQACVLTGRAVHDSPVYRCRTCRHPMLEYELDNYTKHAYKFHTPPGDKSPPRPLAHCPLCHTPILHAALPGKK